MKIEIKSREKRGILDFRIYELTTLGAILDFRTSIEHNNLDRIDVIKEDSKGQSCRVLFDLKDYKISIKEVLDEIKQIEDNYNPEKVSSADEIKLLYEKHNLL